MNNNEFTQDYGRGTGAVVGFLLGAAVGAGVALLLAPASGPETRRRLGQTAKRWSASVRDGMGHASQRFGELKSDVHDRIGELRQDVNTAVSAGREAFTRERDARSNVTSPNP